MLLVLSTIHFTFFTLHSEERMRVPNCSSFFTPPLRHFITLVNTLGFILLILFISGIIEFPSFSLFSQFSTKPIFKDQSKAFTDVVGAFKRWDSEVGCVRFKNEINQQRNNGSNYSFSTSLQDQLECGVLKMKHVSILVKGWTWIPDNLNSMYICPCGLSCLWTKSLVLADNPDAFLFETTKPPAQVTIFLGYDVYTYCFLLCVVWMIKFSYIFYVIKWIIYGSRSISCIQ